MGLNAEGAPRLDGLLVFFYSAFLGLVSSEVMSMLEEFRYRMGDMAKINKSHLFLLPRRQGADRVERLSTYLTLQLNLSHN